MRIAFVFVTLWFGTVIYLIRCRFPLVYAVIEIGVGVGTAIYLGFKFVGLQAENTLLTFALAEVAALYIIVRGYDNFFKGIEKSTQHARLVRLWKKVFLGEDQPAAG